MPLAAVVPIHSRSQGEYVLLQWALPGRPVHNIGVLLLDASTGRSRLRLRDKWDDLAGPEDAAYLAACDADFRQKIDEAGVAGFLESLEESLSHVVRVTQREVVTVDSFSRVADQLFEKHVGKLTVDQYRTHLPLFTLRAAAGHFGPDEAVGEEPEDWVRTPEGLRLGKGMFVAHVVGRSMEPRIPDGSLNVFRAGVVGSRQGKIVLVELLGLHEKYTVKKYTSKKAITGEDEWQHASIRLEPLNPEFEPIDLAPGQLRVVAEWLQTLE